MSEINYRAAGTRINVNHPPSRTDYTIDVRVSNDSVAIRFIVPGTGSRVPNAAMSFTIPSGSIRVVPWCAGPLRGAVPEEIRGSSTRGRMGGAACHLQASNLARTDRSRNPTCGTMRGWRSRETAAAATSNDSVTTIRPAIRTRCAMATTTLSGWRLPHRSGHDYDAMARRDVRTRPERARQQHRGRRPCGCARSVPVPAWRPHAVAEARTRGVAVSRRRREHASRDQGVLEARRATRLRASGHRGPVAAVERCRPADVIGYRSRRVSGSGCGGTATRSGIR